MIHASTGNPFLIEVTRGTLIESCHRGAIAVADAEGRLLLAAGDTERPIFPRSAIKLMQAIPLVASGAADAFSLGDEELAVACASHSGSDLHVATVRRLLAKAGIDEGLLACGVHWPISDEAARELQRRGEAPSAIHNNCSGKHAGMLAAAKQLGFALDGYERPSHPLQQEIRGIISGICGVALGADQMGIDGCSVPTWAFPLSALARGFAGIASGVGLLPEHKAATERLMHACFAAPLMVAGRGRFDTVLMQACSSSIFVKGGAEGVHCAGLPELGLGIAVKVDDGTKRGTERILAELLAILVPEAAKPLAEWRNGTIHSWRGAKVGQLRPAPALSQALIALADGHFLASDAVTR